MANHKASKKSIRRTIRQADINNNRKSRIKTFIVKVEEAIQGGDKNKAKEALQAAQPEIMRGVTKNVIKLRAASRKVSRLAAKVKKMA